MTYFLFHILCLGAFWAFYQVFLKKDTFFERNRWYLLLSLAVAVLAPALDLPLVRQTVESGNLPNFVLLPTLEVGASALLQVFSQEILTSSKTIHWQEIIMGIYWIGFVISLILFLIKLCKLVLLIKATSKNQTRRLMESKNCIEISLAAGERLPTFSFFNYLFWDKSLILSEKEKQQIIAHELAHIKGGHSYDLIFMQLQKIVFWFNPIIYLYEKELRNQHEFIADKQALKLSNTEDYISLMVSNLFKNLQINFTHSFHNQQIKQRIKMLNTKKTSWIKGNAKTVLAVALVALVAFAVACSNALTGIEKDQKLSEMKVAQAQNQENLSKSHVEELDMLLTKYSVTDIKKDGKIEITTKEIPNKKDRERVIFLMSELQGHFLEKAKKQNLAEKPDKDGVYTVTEKMAQPIGGIQEMYKAVAKEIRYPKEARESKVQGKVFVQFIVNTDGSLDKIEVVRGIDQSMKLEEIVVVGYQDKSATEKKVAAENVVNSLHKEAMRVVALAKWNPAEQNGKKVRQRMVMPIDFKLD